MKRLAAAAMLATLAAAPAHAELKVGAKAPDFTLQGFQAGKPVTFSLAEARKKGPVVVYFFPAANTPGCNIEASLFANAADEFKAKGATVIGVTAGNLDQLQTFSADKATCSGKFPVAADPSAKVATGYEAVMAARGLSSRTSYVISPAGQVVAAHSEMNPANHVTAMMTAVNGLKR